MAYIYPDIFSKYRNETVIKRMIDIKFDVIVIAIIVDFFDKHS